MAKTTVKPEIASAIRQNTTMPDEVKRAIAESCQLSKGYDVYITKNYDIFKRLLGNRDTTSVKRIIDSIKKIGYVDNPLIVNERLEIIDGQNRLEAFRILDLPAPFHIVYGIGIDEARQLNIGRGNWKPIDWVRSYAETGNDNYLQLLNFYDMTHFDISLIIQLSKGIVNHTAISAKFYNGGNYEMTIEEKNVLISTLPWLIKIKPIIDSMTGNKRLKYMAFAFCYNVKGVDRRRLQKILEKDYFNIIPYPDSESYLKEISKWYNKGLKTTSTMRFDYIYMSNGEITE